MSPERLRCRVNRIAEVVVNVSDLDRTIDFYETNTPLRVHARSEAAPQPFPGLGIARGEWRGALMSDATSIEPGTSVHFVEWHDPAPTGPAYETFFHAGFQRMCFQVADPLRTYEELSARGIRPYAPPVDRGVLVVGDKATVSFSFPDPDGVAIHITRRPPAVRPDVPEQLYHVSPVVPDTDAARAFFEDVLGLECRIRLHLSAPAPAGYGEGSTTGQFDAAILGHRGDRRFHVDLVNWVVPGVVGTASTEPTRLGIQRLAFEVDDVALAHAALLEALPVELRRAVHPPETWDLGPAGTRRLVLFASNDGLPLELVQATSSVRRGTQSP
jgi:catechol 2,3-dioxygenase-like lactoylglutathione lyase family enzyme